MPIPRPKVIERLRGGETIVHVLPRGNSETEEAYQYLSGGGRVTKATYRFLRSKLTPVSTGLFPDSEPQEWEWAGD